MKSAFDEMMKGLDDVESFLAGKREGFRVHVPEQVDVKAIRTNLKLTQAAFSGLFGFSLDAVKHWEGGRRTPDPSARAYLTIIDKAPSMVIDILAPAKTSHRKQQPASKRRASAVSGTRLKISTKSKKPRSSYALA